MTGRKFIFTITTGRSGTAYLSRLIADNIQDSTSHHEILGYDRFGVDTPDVSHMTLFNSEGSINDKVKQFWRLKTQRILSCETSVYCETSHLLIKCGLFENLCALMKHGTVHFVVIKREFSDTLRSFAMRHDFANLGNMWMWYLDPNYPKNLLRLRDEMTPLNIGAWYILEMRARSAYYQEKAKATVGLNFHNVDFSELIESEGAANLFRDTGLQSRSGTLVIPPRVNQNNGHLSGMTALNDAVSKLALRIQGFDPDLLGTQAAQTGLRF